MVKTFRSYTMAVLFCLPVISWAQADSLQQITESKNSSPQQKLDAYVWLVEYYSIKDFDKAILLNEKAKALVKETRDSVAYANLVRITGVAYYFKGQYEKAASLFYEAITLLEKFGEKKHLAFALNDIAKLYRKTRDLDKALQYYDRAQQLFTDLRDSSGIQMILNESGVIFEYKKDYKEAIRRYEASLEIARALNDEVGIGYALSFIAGVYVIQKNYTEAEKYLQQVLVIREKLKDTFTLALTHTDLGVLYSAKGDYQKAIQSLTISNQVAEQLKYPELQSSNYQELSTIASNNGNFQAALDYYKKHTTIRDSLFSVEKTKQVTELNTKYETAKKEQQILLQRSELSRKNLAIAAISILVVLAALLSYSLYRRHRLKQKAVMQAEIMRQQELSTRAVLEAEERERQRIAKDLHDGVGQIMSAAKMNLSAFENELTFNDPEQRRKFERIITLVDESCKEVRSVSHNMMPNALLKAGLASAIREFTDKIDDKIIKIDLYSEGLNERMDTNLETVLYRVIQECVNNVIKHANANHLDISLIKDSDGISATVEDNGKGFDMEDSSKFDGLGLKNIRTRVEYLKGTVEYDSKPGKGTLVAIHVPA